MDSLITAAARALAAGDPLGALKRVALRDDAPALALRGIAMAQLGDLARAKTLLRRAARAFGPREAVARARCVVAEAEIALVSRDLGFPTQTLDAARATLDAHGDRVNAAHARYLELRRLLRRARRGRAARWGSTLVLPSRVEDRARAGDRWHRDSAAADEGGARGARSAEQAAREARIRALRGGRTRVGVLNTPAARLIARGQARRCCFRMPKRCSRRTRSSWTPAGMPSGRRGR
jgi:hypothetical protein